MSKKQLITVEKRSTSSIMQNTPQKAQNQRKISIKEAKSGRKQGKNTEIAVKYHENRTILCHIRLYRIVLMRKGNLL